MGTMNKILVEVQTGIKNESRLVKQLVTWGSKELVALSHGSCSHLVTRLTLFGQATKTD